MPSVDTPEKRMNEEKVEDKRKEYEPPLVTEVFVDPARDMLVVCASAKLPSQVGRCVRRQFT